MMDLFLWQLTTIHDLKRSCNDPSDGWMDELDWTGWMGRCYVKYTHKIRTQFRVECEKSLRSQCNGSLPQLQDAKAKMSAL